MVPFFRDDLAEAPHDSSSHKFAGKYVDLSKEEVVSTVGSSHQLHLKRRAVYRPTTFLKRLYTRKGKDLDETDIAAAWAVLHAFKTPQVVVYNCGPNSGMPEGHIEVFPQPSRDSIHLFPSKAISFKGK
jgi:ATP adenylyltransferase/5',5'''-P-1,P-4-tetraphosphate phosphorylase II